MMVNYRRRIIVFADPRIQAYFEEFLKERLGLTDVWAWKRGRGESRYEALRNEFLRKTVYPSAIKIIKRVK